MVLIMQNMHILSLAELETGLKCYLGFLTSWRDQWTRSCWALINLLQSGFRVLISIMLSRQSVNAFWMILPFGFHLGLSGSTVAFCRRQRPESGQFNLRSNDACLPFRPTTFHRNDAARGALHYARTLLSPPPRTLIIFLKSFRTRTYFLNLSIQVS